MKILIISSWFYDYTIQLANAVISKPKVDDVMLILPKDMKMYNYLSYVNKDINSFYYEEFRPIYSPENLLSLYKIIKNIKNFNPDIIHFQFSGKIYIALLLLFVRKYTIITTFHDPKPHIGAESFILRFSMYWTRIFSNAVIVHGRKLKEIFIKNYKFEQNKVFNIPIGPSHDINKLYKFKNRDIVEQDIIMFFGEIRKYKGLEYLIGAQPLISREFPEVKIVIAGKGESFEKYERRMINIERFVIKNYWITHEESADLFQKAKLIVLPYIDASQSGVISLAYEFKKPVIVTDVGSIPELVDDGITGLIVPPKDTKALADAIIKLLRNEKLRHEMGENAYKKLKKDLSWDKISEKTIEIYDKVKQIRKR